MELVEVDVGPGPQIAADSQAASVGEEQVAQQLSACDRGDVVVVAVSGCVVGPQFRRFRQQGTVVGQPFDANAVRCVTNVSELDRYAWSLITLP